MLTGEADRRVVLSVTAQLPPTYSNNCSLKMSKDRNKQTNKQTNIVGLFINKTLNQM